MRKKPKAEPLKIGIDARLAYRRGVGTYSANLVLALSRVDSKNRYFIFNAPPELRSAIRNPRFSFESVPFLNAVLYEQRLLPTAARALGLDFLHYVDNSGPVFGDFPFILTLHDAMHQRPLSEFRSNPTFRQKGIHFYKRWAIPRALKKAGAVVTVSEYSKSEILREAPGLEGKIFVTPEGVDQKLFKRFPRKPSKLFKILVQGATDERKNLSRILKAAKILKSQKKVFQLVVIGMGQEELKRTSYVRLCAELDLGRQVEWAGTVPPELLNQVYAEADILLYPSLLEGFGLPVLEAFACGVPVITSQTTALPEVAGDASLLVDPESPEAIAGAVRRLMEKPVLRKKLAGLGRRRAGLFSWERTARETLKAYKGFSK